MELFMIMVCLGLLSLVASIFSLIHGNREEDIYCAMAGLLYGTISWLYFHIAGQMPL